MRSDVWRRPRLSHKVAGKRASAVAEQLAGMDTAEVVTPMLALNALSVRLAGREVLRNVELSVAPRQIVGVTGPNGAGKTTLLRVAANLVRPAKGRRVGSPRLAYVPAAIDPPVLTARSWLVGVRQQRREPFGVLLERLGFDGHLDRPCRELSFGNFRKLLLADAFSSWANLIVLDEASEGLDSHGAAALVELMAQTRSQGGSILFAEQQTQRMVGVDRVVWLQRRALAVESFSSDGEVTLRFRGPVAAVSELAERAEALGFRYVIEDQ